MEIRLLESAKEDLRSGYWFYEVQSEGLGAYFLDCVQADVRSLQFFAEIHAKAEGFFRVLVRKFPFAIYYLIEENCVDIYAILDCRRDPTWIQSKLRALPKPS